MLPRQFFALTRFRSIRCVTQSNITTSLTRLCSSVTGNSDALEISTKNQKILQYLERIKLEYQGLKSIENRSKSDQKRILVVAHLAELVEQRNTVLDNIRDLDKLKTTESDPEMVKMMNDEHNAYQQILGKLDEELVEAILAMDEGEDYAAIYLEVTAGVGGQEAMLFAKELFDTYCGYCDYKEWDLKILHMDETDLRGLRHASALVSGPDAFRCLRYEGGVHRVQRVPTTEKSGRVHTSTVTVAVIPKPDDYEMDIKDKDLRVETKRASGAGGQHVNTTDSAVRITHLPSGIVAECQTERSQHRNRDLAMQKLKARLFQQHFETQEATTSANRKSQVGQANRNEKIRTYNFPQDRVTDHRIANGSMHNLRVFMNGGADLDLMISRLSDDTRRRQLMQIIDEKVSEK